MALSVLHSLTMTTPDDPAFENRPSHWNAGHVISGLGTDPYVSPAQIVQVSKDCTPVTGQWYNSVKSACDYAATVALTANRVVVYVYPGEYTESPFTIPSFTYVCGIDEWGGSHIITNDNSNHFITMASNSGFQRCAVTGPTGSAFAAIRHNNTGTSKVCWVNIRVGDYGVYCSQGRMMLIGVVNDTGTTPSRLFCADSTGALAMVSSHAMMGGNWTGKYGVHVSGSARVLMDLCVFRTPSGTSALVTDSAYVRANSCSFASGTTGLEHSGAGSTAHFNGCDFAPTGYTTEILCSATGASTMIYSGTASHAKISHTGSIVPILQFADGAAGDPGTHIVGELYVGPDMATGFTPVTSYIDAVATTGKYSGGVVSRNAGRAVDVTAGTAMFDQGAIMAKVSWNAANITLPANTDEIWVIVDSGGTVSSTTTEPDLTTTVVLALAVTDATDVMFLSPAVLDLGNVPERTKELNDYGVGGVMAEGGDLSLNGLGFDVAAGTSILSLNKIDFTATTGATFYYWRRDGSGGWIQLAGQTSVNTTQYDDGTGTLATMTAGFYRSDLVFVCHPGGGKEFHVVIGQAEYATANEAKLNRFTVLPDILEEYAVRIGLLVVLKSAAAIVEVQDRRVKANVFKRNWDVPHNILSAGTQVANTSGIVKFADSNGITWGMNNSSQITASINAGGTASIYATGNTTQSSSGSAPVSSLIFQGAGNVSVGVSNGSVVVSGGTASPSPIVVSAGTSSASISNLVFSDSNGFSFGLNGSTITGNYSQSTHSHRTDFKAMTLGGNTAGTTTFNASNNDTVWLNGGNNITLSGNGSTITIVGPNTVAQTNQSAIKAFGVSNTGQTAGNTGVSTGIDWVLAGSQSITMSQSTAVGGPNTVWVQHPAWLTTAMQSNAATISNIKISAGTASQTRSDITFNDSNGISFGLGTGANAGIITGTVKTDYLTSQSTQFQAMTLGGNTAGTTTFNATNNATLWFNGGNNITLSGNGSTVTISAANQSADTAGIYVTAQSTGQSSSSTYDVRSLSFVPDGIISAGWSNGSFRVSATQSNQAVSNSAGSFTFQTLNFSNANNVTFGTSAGGIITASVAAPGAAAENNWVNLLGANTAGNTTASGSTIGYSGINVTLSGTNNSVVNISAPATSSLVGTSGLSISTAGSTISVYKVADSFYQNVPMVWSTQSQTFNQSTSYVWPMDLKEIESVGFIQMPHSISFASTSFASTGNTSYSYNMAETHNLVLYSRGTGANSMSLQSVFSTSGSLGMSWRLSRNTTNNISVSYGFSYPVSNGTSSVSSSYAATNSSDQYSTTQFTSLNGLKFIDTQFATALDGKMYWMAYGMSTTQTTQQTAALSNARMVHSLMCVPQTNAAVGMYGSSNAASHALQFGIGSFTTAGGGTTASIPISAISSSVSHLLPYVKMANIA